MIPQTFYHDIINQANDLMSANKVTEIQFSYIPNVNPNTEMCAVKIFYLHIPNREVCKTTNNVIQNLLKDSGLSRIIVHHSVLQTTEINYQFSKLKL